MRLITPLRHVYWQRAAEVYGLSASIFLPGEENDYEKAEPANHPGFPKGNAQKG